MPAWIWEKQLDHFSKDYTVVAMEPRSHGDSQQATEGHYAYCMARDIKSVVDGLKLESFVLIGWSLAVPQVINYTVRFSDDRLKGLVLVDGAVGINATMPFYQNDIDFWLRFQEDRKANTSEFVRTMFQQPQSEEYFEKLISWSLRTPTNTMIALIDNYFLQDHRPLLPKIKVPTWFVTVQGRRLEYFKEIAKEIPNCRLDIIPDAAHTVFVDQPEKFNSLMESFLKGVV